MTKAHTVRGSHGKRLTQYEAHTVLGPPRLIAFDLPTIIPLSRTYG